MIHSQVCRQEEMVVPGHLDALNMRPEIALRNAPESLEKELVTDLTHGTVLIDPEHCDLAVVIAGYKEELVLIVCGEVGTSHAVDRSEIDLLQISALDDLVSFNTKVSDRIQELSVVRDRHIG